MFTHGEVWLGIDRLAKRHSLSASALARKAGLDPTTFNPSKRITKQAKPRWPSTESIAKILQATNTPFGEFVSMMGDDVPAEGGSYRGQLKCLDLGRAGREEVFDSAGFPRGERWDEIDFPGLHDSNAYALEVTGGEHQPVFRDGDLLVVAPSTGVRRHDRIVVKPNEGPLLIAWLRHRSAQRIDIELIGSGGNMRSLPVSSIDWIARIVWASQ